MSRIFGIELWQSKRNWLMASDPFQGLRDEIYLLHVNWKMHVELFGTSPERIEKLNRRLGKVFRRFQDVISEYLILGIAKVFDVGERPYGLHAAIKELPDGPKGSPESVVKGQLVAEFDTLKKKCDPIIMHRCKRIAHSDRTILTGEEFLLGISRAMIREAMADISDLYNESVNHEARSKMVFQSPPIWK